MFQNERRCCQYMPALETFDAHLRRILLLWVDLTADMSMAIIDVSGCDEKVFTKAAPRPFAAPVTSMVGMLSKCRRQDGRDEDTFLPWAANKFTRLHHSAVSETAKSS